MISPTGNGIRYSDKWGLGTYGAPRDNGTRIHKGVDFIVSPVGQNIVAPCNGDVIRVKYPYANPVKGTMFSGILVRSPDFEWTMFYFEPLKEIMKTRIEEGQLIGHAQEISKKYPGIIDHVHLQINSINPELFIRLP